MVILEELKSHSKNLKNLMTRNPSLSMRIYSAKALALMSERKITSLLVVSDKDQKRKIRF